MPKLLIVMKHGAFDERGAYKTGDARKIRKIAKYLQKIIHGRPAKILTSDDDSCAKTTHTVNEILSLPTFESEQLRSANAPYTAAVTRLLNDRTINRFDVFLLIVAEPVIRDALRVTAAGPFAFTIPCVEILEIPNGAFVLIDTASRTVHFLRH